MSAGLGYTDTPILPDTGFHVHDGARPQPKIVGSGAADYDSMHSRPPSDAVILFDGSGLDMWRGRDGDTAWRLEGGYMIPVKIVIIGLLLIILSVCKYT